METARTPATIAASGPAVCHRRRPPVRAVHRADGANAAIHFVPSAQLSDEPEELLLSDVLDDVSLDVSEDDSLLAWVSGLSFFLSLL
jgi:hypothetical protein